MHFVFSYDLSVDAGQRRTQIVNEIEQIINVHRNVRRLSTFYIIHVNNNQEWDLLREKLVNLAQKIPERLHFIMTPPQRGGHYDGLLSTGEWDEINIISTL